MKLTFTVLFVILIFSCKKDHANSPLQGLWIETTLRLDSIEFTDAFATSDGKYGMQLKSKPYMDVTQNPTYPVNHSSIYNYYLGDPYMYLYNLVSSSMVYNKYEFHLGDDLNHFTIKRFYSRNSLPDIIAFEKIK